MNLAGLKRSLRRQFMDVIEPLPDSPSISRWTAMLCYKLIYAIVFVTVIMMVYQFWAAGTLSAMPDPMIRSEQFFMSAMLHYPAYLLLAVLCGLVAVLSVNVLVIIWGQAAALMYRRMTQRERVELAGRKTEVTHD